MRGVYRVDVSDQGDRVKALVASPSKGERVAAIELLRSWGEEAWLEQTLLGPVESGEMGTAPSDACAK